MIHIITVGWNNWIDSKELIDSVYNCTKDFQLIFVNNGSTDNTHSEIQNYLKNDNFHYINLDKNYGFSGGFNRGLEYSHKLNSDQEQEICIINNDIVVRNNWLDNLKEAYINCEKGINVNVPLGNNTLGYISPLNNYTAEIHQRAEENQKPSWCNDSIKYFQASVPFMCLFFKKKMLDNVGYLDAEVSPFGMMEDTDYNYRLSLNNYVNYIASTSWVFHKGSRTVFKVPNISAEHSYAMDRMNAKHKLWAQTGRKK